MVKCDARLELLLFCNPYYSSRSSNDQYFTSYNLDNWRKGHFVDFKRHLQQILGEQQLGWHVRKMYHLHPSMSSVPYQNMGQNDEARLAGKQGGWARVQRENPQGTGPVRVTIAPGHGGKVVNVIRNSGSKDPLFVNEHEWEEGRRGGDHHPPLINNHIVRLVQQEINWIAIIKILDLFENRSVIEVFHSTTVVLFHWKLGHELLLARIRTDISTKVLLVPKERSRSDHLKSKVTGQGGFLKGEKARMVMIGSEALIRPIQRPHLSQTMRVGRPRSWWAPLSLSPPHQGAMRGIW